MPVIRTEHSTRVYDHWLCRPFSRWSLRRATAVVAVSDFLRRQICAHVPAVAARVSVIRNGVSSLFANAAPSSLAAHDGPLRLGVVARLEPRKGIDQAIAALAMVEGPRLDIVGDGPCRPALEKQVAALGLGDRVRFWGYRNDPETIIAELDAVLCSSRTEGLPVGLLEGMALGRPVIAVPVGGVPEIVADGETGWLAAGSLDGGAGRDDALSGRARARRAGAAGRESARRRRAPLHRGAHARELRAGLPRALAQSGQIESARRGTRVQTASQGRLWPLLAAWVLRP